MTIQQACKQSGLTIDTIRYYERIGLIEAEKALISKITVVKRLKHLSQSKNCARQGAIDIRNKVVVIVRS